MSLERAPEEDLEFSKTMILTMARLTREIRDLKFSEDLFACSQQGSMLAACHFYCALKSHNLMVEGERRPQLVCRFGLLLAIYSQRKLSVSGPSQTEPEREAGRGEDEHWASSISTELE